MQPGGTQANAGDVSSQVFESFLNALAATDVAAETRERLRKVLLGENPITEKALEAAILGKDA